MTLAFRAVPNPLAGPYEWVPPTRDALAFHRRMPGYAPTPLLSVPALARTLGIGELLAKCESERLELPSFKMLGASWATYRAVCERAGDDFGDWRDVDDLAERMRGLRPFALAAATDGNHGRAVARMAHLLGFGARIFVPAGTSPARVDAIAGEGAEVLVVDGGYDDAVARSSQEEGPRCLVISDTSWPGYTDVPSWVIDGYSTLFFEIADALETAAHRGPDLVMVPVGVGALAAAAVAHFRPSGTRIVGVEPTDAACMTASVLAGEPVTLAEPQRSIMVGLNCGTPSRVAWPAVSHGVDGFVTIDDDWTRQAVRDLAAAGIEAGETGAAALAGLTALQVESRSWNEAPDVPLAGIVEPDSSVLVLVTEGASDRTSWRSIVGVEEVGTPQPSTA